MIPLFTMSDFIMKINKTSSDKLDVGQIMTIYIEKYKIDPSNSYFEHLENGIAEYKIYFEDVGEIAKFKVESPNDQAEKIRKIKKINVIIKKLNKTLNNYETVKQETILIMQ